MGDERYRRDLSAHHLRGVIIFEFLNDRAESARFHLEPVDDDDASVRDAVRARVVRESAVSS